MKRVDPDTLDDSGKLTINFVGKVTFRLSDLWGLEGNTEDAKAWAMNEWAMTLDPFASAIDVHVQPTVAEVTDA